MKTLRRLCAALVLTLTLMLPTNAGHIPCGVTDDPPPSTQQATPAGDITNEVAGEKSTGHEGDMWTGGIATDPVTEILLNLLQSLLTLF